MSNAKLALPYASTPHHATRTILAGPWLPGALLIAAMVSWLLWPVVDVDSVRAVIRATARTSLFCFLMAFTAQAWWQLAPSPLTAWMRRYRRQWGVLLVTSHTVHLAFILTFHHLDPAGFQKLVPMLTVYSGIVAYAFLWLMGLSSNDLVARWMGKVWWTRLHWWGSHVLWLIFLFANGKRAIIMNPFYSLPVALLLGALALRYLAKRQDSPL